MIVLSNALYYLRPQLFSTGATDIHFLAVKGNIDWVVDDKISRRIAPLPARPVGADIDHAVDADRHPIFHVSNSDGTTGRIANGAVRA